MTIEASDSTCSDYFEGYGDDDVGYCLGDGHGVGYGLGDGWGDWSSSGYGSGYGDITDIGYGEDGDAEE
jgi:hypothetical protein